MNLFIRLYDDANNLRFFRNTNPRGKMKKNISATISLTLLLLSISVFADAGSYGNEQKKATAPFNQGDDTLISQMGYNHPARVDTTSDWDMFLTAQFLYWDVQQEGMEIGPTFPSYPSSGVQTSGVLDFKDSYRCGFKVGLGWNTPFDDWVVLAEYTWFHHDLRKDQGSPYLTSNFLQAKVTPFDYTTQDLLTASSHKWNIDLDMVDVILSRPCYQGTKLTITPFFGLRGLMLNQKYTLTGTVYGGTNNPTTAYGKTDSWAIGPAFGLGGNFLLGEGFRLIGSASGALTYTRYNDIKYFAKRQSVGSSDLELTHSAQNRVRAMADAKAGIGWGSYLCNQSYHIDFSATYEFQVLWNQNMINWYSASLVGLNGASPGNLYFQGLTITGTFDF